jgi:hypothetical protein
MTGLPNAQGVLLTKANSRGVGTKSTHMPGSGRIGDTQRVGFSYKN